MPVTEYKPEWIQGLKTSGESKFKSPLEAYLKQVQANPLGSPNAGLGSQSQQDRLQGAPVTNYFAYGQDTSIDDVLSGQSNDTNTDSSNSESDMSFMQFARGGIVPAFAQGGTRYGDNSHGILNMLFASGKPRVDYRHGDAVTGQGDGQSDDIPAMLADGEFVIPADVVSALGNGSTKAGSDKLYEMMHSIRKRARSTHVKDLPPPAKSPLSYLSSKKARR